MTLVKPALPPPAEAEDDAIHLLPEDIGPLPEMELDSDEPEMEGDLHQEQMFLLLLSLRWAFRHRRDYYTGGNLTIYYKLEQLERRTFRGPDFFVVLGVDSRRRRSWVVWREGGRYPNVIVEILSRRTAAADRGLKKQIYQDVFRTPEYFLFDPETRELTGYRLQGGTYEPIAAIEAGRLRSEQLDLLLGLHDGVLRLFTPDGVVVPTPEEAEQARADRAEAEKARLAAKLREMGIDPDKLR